MAKEDHLSEYLPMSSNKPTNIITTIAKPAGPESPIDVVFGDPDLPVTEEDIILPGCYYGAIGDQLAHKLKL